MLPADVPVRQWVLSVPHPLRYRLAYDHRLCRTVLHVFVRALRSAYRRQARCQGLAAGETGMVTSVQRFGGAVNVHLHFHFHFHTLVLNVVFVREPDGTLRFHPAAPPTDKDVHRVVARVRRRLERLGLAGATIADEDADPLSDESAALASLSRAAILGRTALGRRAGRGPVRIGADPDAPWVERHVPHDAAIRSNDGLKIYSANGNCATDNDIINFGKVANPTPSPDNTWGCDIFSSSNNKVFGNRFSGNVNLNGGAADFCKVVSGTGNCGDSIPPAPACLDTHGLPMVTCPALFPSDLGPTQTTAPCTVEPLK